MYTEVLLRKTRISFLNNLRFVNNERAYYKNCERAPWHLCADLIASSALRYGGIVDHCDRVGYHTPSAVAALAIAGKFLKQNIDFETGLLRTRLC